MKLGFTGTQTGMNKYQREKFDEALDKYNPDELHHGDCIGADSQAHYAFLRWHVRNDNKERAIFVHPPINRNKRAFTNKYELYSQELRDQLAACKHKVTFHIFDEKPYLERNLCIVDQTDMLVATPKEMEHTVRSGTWATIRRAWHTKKIADIIPPLDD